METDLYWAALWTGWSCQIYEGLYCTWVNGAGSFAHYKIVTPRPFRNILLLKLYLKFPFTRKLWMTKICETSNFPL